MTATAEARQATVPTINFKQRKRLSRSAHVRRKPIYQAVFAPLPTSQRARTAACDCIKDGNFIDPPYNTGNDFFMRTISAWIVNSGQLSVDSMTKQVTAWCGIWIATGGFKSVTRKVSREPSL